jgi:hypothetical protein
MPTEGVEKMFAHRDRALPGRAVVVEVHARDVLEHAAERRDAAGGECLRIDDCDRRRHVLHFLRAARGRDDDFFHFDLVGGDGRRRAGQGYQPPRCRGNGSVHRAIEATHDV